MKQKNIIAGVVLLALGLAYGWLALQLPERPLTGALSPSFFPLITASLLIVFSASLVFQGLFITPAETDKPPRPPGFGQAVAMLACFFIYIVALGFVGFVMASIPFFVILMMMFGERRLLVLAAGSLGVTLFLFVLFEQGLYLHVPFGEDWRFSIPLPKSQWLEF